MALKKAYIEGTPGLTYIEDVRLGAGIEVMLVLREGKPLVETTGTPTGRQFNHTGSEYRIYVDATMPVIGIAETDPGGTSDILRPEIFYVEYKAN